jgi:hypothetical protein
MSKMEFIHKMNVIQNKNATKLILNQDRVNQAVMNFEKGNVRCLMTSGFSKTSFSTAKNLNCLNLENESSPTFERSKFAIGEAYRTRLDIGNIFKQGGTADDAKSSIETFNNKWGDRDFGGGLTESLKEDTARMFRLNASEACANFVRCLMTSGFSKTSFSTAKNLNCLNLENESSPTFERSKFAISFLIRVLSSVFYIIF